MPSLFDLHCATFSARRTAAGSRPSQGRESLGSPLLAALLWSLFCVSCGAVGSGPPPAPASVVVTPASAQPFTGASVQFNAQVQNASGSVNWMVNQVPQGNSTVGTISASGKYTAPRQIPASGATVTVTAALQAEPSVSGSASVTIQLPSATQGPLTLSPALASVTTSQPLQLNVQTAGVSNSDVSWAVACVPAGTCVPGTISQTGLFTPPSVASSNVVTATLLANRKATGAATVEVTDFAGTLTWRNDNSRSGVNSRELALAPSTVSPSTFGRLFSCPIDGAAYAQPLYVPNLAIPGNGTHNVVIVATEMDSVYAFDADANPCQTLWHSKNLVPLGMQPVSSSTLDIVPWIGITGTPVISPSTTELYAVVAAQTIESNPSDSHLLYALDLTTGSIIGVSASILSPDQVFASSGQLQRAALLLDNGTVYIAFGSNGSLNMYHGWLFAYDAGSLIQTGAFDVTPPPPAQQGFSGGFWGGIWQSGGGPSADSDHNVFAVTGDGPFNANVNPQSASYSDSFLRLQFVPAQGFSVADYFTPCDQAALQAAGLDIGASAPVLLPDSAGSAPQPHLLIGGSKQGVLYVVNRDNMGGFVGSPCPGADSPPRVQTVSATGPILSTPLYWNGAVYVAPGNGSLSAYPMAGGMPSPFPSSTQPSETLGAQGATPVLSWDGTNNADAILWLIDTSGALTTPNGPAILRAYDPSNNLNEIYSSATASGSRDQAGLAVKFTVPTVANGKVYVGTQTELDVYGLLP